MEDVLAKIADASKALILISMVKGIDGFVAAAIHGLADTIASATDSALQMAEDITRNTRGYYHSPDHEDGVVRGAQCTGAIDITKP
jgi:hypothetical protein